MISEISDMENQILTIFNDNKDKEIIKNLVSIDLGKIPIGMSTFQIENFVLNRKEFSTPLMQYQQTKMELYNRINTFIDFYYQLREAQTRIKLSEGRIEELNNDKNKDFNHNQKVREAKIELQQIEIEKNEFKIQSIEKQAKEKLRETIVFYKTFDKYKYLENLPQEELDKMEEEGWRIKSAYYQELVDRYGLTPRGFMLYPHEKTGLPGLLDSMENNGILPLQIRSKESD